MAEALDEMSADGDFRGICIAQTKGLDSSSPQAIDLIDQLIQSTVEEGRHWGVRD